MENNRIYQLRKERNMSQVRLGVELAVAQETVSAYEKGKAMPAIPTLIKMSEVFMASIDYILGLSDIRYPVNAETLPSEELQLLALFRGLDHTKREKALSYLEGLQK